MFGSTRTALSGSNSKVTASDTLHPDLFIECKLKAKDAVHTLYEDTRQKAKVENKIPMLALKKKGARGFLIVARPEDLPEIVGHLNLNHEDEQQTAESQQGD